MRGADRGGVPADEATCAKCGEALGEAAFCGSCGTPVPATVGAVAEPTSPPPAAPPAQTPPPPPPLSPPPPPTAGPTSASSMPTRPAPTSPPPVAAPSSPVRRSVNPVPVVVVAGVSLVAVIGAVVLLGGGGGDVQIMNTGDMSLAGAPTSEPSQVWSLQLPDDAWVSDLASDGDNAFAAIVEDDDVELVSWRLSDGEERWTTDLESGLTHVSLEVISGQLVATSSVLESDGPVTIAVIDPGSGDVRWDDSYDGGWAFAWRVNGGLAVYDNEEVRVLDLHTGDERWSADSQTATSTADAVVLVDDDDLEVRGVDGSERWSDDLDAEAPPVAVRGDTLFVAEGDRVTARALDNGADRWDARVDDEIWYLEATAAGGVIVSSLDGEVAFDRDGNELWDDSDGLYGVMLRVAGNDVLVSAADEQLAVYDLETGRRLERARFDDDEWVWDESGAGDPLARGLFLTKAGREVNAYDLTDLELRWSYRAEADVVATLATGDGVLLFGYGDAPVIEFAR